MGKEEMKVKKMMMTLCVVAVVACGSRPAPTRDQLEAEYLAVARNSEHSVREISGLVHQVHEVEVTEDGLIMLIVMDRVEEHGARCADPQGGKCTYHKYYSVLYCGKSSIQSGDKIKIVEISFRFSTDHPFRLNAFCAIPAP